MDGVMTISESLSVTVIILQLQYMLLCSIKFLETLTKRYVSY